MRNNKLIISNEHNTFYMAFNVIFHKIMTITALVVPMRAVLGKVSTIAVVHVPAATAPTLKAAWGHAIVHKFGIPVTANQ